MSVAVFLPDDIAQHWLAHMKNATPLDVSDQLEMRAALEHSLLACDCGKEGRNEPTR